MRTVLLLSLAALALAGCSNKPQGGPDPDDKAANAGKPKTDGDRIADAIEKGMERPEGHYDIPKPGTKWNASTASMVAVGAKMDERARETKDSLCRAVFTYDDPSVGKLTGKPEIRIQDADSFEVEYMLPETKGTFNRIKGDGKRRGELIEAGWVEVRKSSDAVRHMGERDVREWPRRFPVEMFSQYTKGVDAWAPLFEAWANGVGGYKAVFEEQTFKQGKETASHYRVYAETQEGGATTIEVIIDKEHLRPLTVKVNGTLEDGREYDMYWTGEWFTGGKYDEGAFKLPPMVPRVAKAS